MRRCWGNHPDEQPTRRSPCSTIHTITPRHNGKRFDIVNASTAAGAAPQHFRPSGGRNQEFLLSIVG